MNWKECGRKELWLNLKYCLSICVNELREAMKILSHDSQCPRQDFKWEPPEYKSEWLLLESGCLGKVVLVTGLFMGRYAP
jgi:hypothetical protein